MVNAKANPKRLAAMESLKTRFSSIGYHFDDFFVKYPLDDKDPFLSYLLYCFYYDEVTFDRETVEYTLLILLAECVDESTLKKVLLAVPDKIHQKILAYGFLNVREGVLKIHRALEVIYQHDKNWKTLLYKIKSKYFDPAQLLQDTASIAALVGHLESDSSKKVALINDLLPKVVEAIIAAPLKGFDMFSGMLGETPSSGEQRSRLEKAQDELKALFAPYINKIPPLASAIEFFQLYGLTGHMGGGYNLNSAGDTIDQELSEMSKLLAEPGFIPPHFLSPLIHFVHDLLEAFHTFVYQPEKYAEGLALTVYAMPTRGNALPEQDWLPSVVHGIGSVVSFLHHRGYPSAKLSDYPIVVFDQSKAKQFVTNAKYIEGFINRDGANIWHLSKRQTLRLAKKIGIENWIETTPNKDFGFGGARNAVMFLAPVIHGAVKEGIENFDSLINLPRVKLQDYYQRACLGIAGQDSIIHMGEDDVYIPECNFYSDALSAEKLQDQYFERYSMCVGRSTLKVNVNVGSEALEDNPLHLFQSTIWKTAPEGGGMKATMMKPKFCLPLPFGSEERHVSALTLYNANFEQPVVHLAGPRLPKKLFPTQPLDGVLPYIRTYVEYIFGMTLVSGLIDPQNKLKRCILPWNSLPPGSFSNLNELLEYAKSSQMKLMTKDGFWKNFETEFIQEIDESSHIKKFIAKFAPVQNAEKIPKPLLNYFKLVSEDLALVLQLANQLYQHKMSPNHVKDIGHSFDSKHYPLTFSLCVIVQQMSDF